MFKRTITALLAVASVAPGAAFAQQAPNPTQQSIDGLGETKPVATNGTVAGRQQNRRFELVVSGESIGTH